MKRRYASSLVALALLVGAIANLGPASARPDGGGAPNDVRRLEGDLNGGKPLPINVRGSHSPARPAAKQGKPHVGDMRNWLADDDIKGELYLKRFKLRGVGKHIEVWTAHDQDTTSKNLGFQYGDCRNDERIVITNKQVHYLIRQFEKNIYPKERKTFRKPPDRDGSDAILPFLIDQPKKYYKGNAKHTVVLIDNVRDDNFYDFDNSEGHSYIAGFFSSQYNELFDRNVMTIDSYDWVHRTGPHPPDHPVPGNFCKSKPARPFTYESTFAHEYQHLLEYYSDADEGNWINEGMSMWAESALTHYDFPRAPVTSSRHFPHLQAFLGWENVQTDANPNPYAAGPENSLTLWGDQTGDEILADYGAATSMMLYLGDQYGKDFMSKLHHNHKTGLKSLETLLADADPGTSAEDAVHRWLATDALDGILDDGASLTGGDEDDYSSKHMNATIYWDTPHAYDTDGAPPNGADFVRLRSGTDYLNASQIHNIDFDGAETLPPLPVEWTQDDNPPDHDGNPALYSGMGDNLDRAIVRQVSVPANDATLKFDTFYDIEQGYDGGFVQVSTDGGKTYDTLANDDTNDEWSTSTPGPGFSGSSGEWKSETFDLSAYAGQDVQLAFHYITDGGVALNGWWIDNVMVGGTTISTGDDLASWKSPSEVHATEVFGFTVQLIAYDEAHDAAWIFELPLNDQFEGSLQGNELSDAIGDSAQTVAALVTYDEPTEAVNQYAPYTLKVNGETQPGGGQ